MQIRFFGLQLLLPLLVFVCLFLQLFHLSGRRGKFIQLSAEVVTFVHQVVQQLLGFLGICRGLAGLLPFGNQLLFHFRQALADLIQLAECILASCLFLLQLFLLVAQLLLELFQFGDLFGDCLPELGQQLTGKIGGPLMACPQLVHQGPHVIRRVADGLLRSGSRHTKLRSCQRPKASSERVIFSQGAAPAQRRGRP